MNITNGPIGEPQRVIQIEPVEEPVPTPVRVPDSPADLPEREPERVG